MLVEKGVPLSTPLHLPGQAAAFGRVLDGKQLASLKMKDMKASVDRMKEVMIHLIRLMANCCLTASIPPFCVVVGAACGPEACGCAGG